jgi:hypothetical protein
MQDFNPQNLRYAKLVDRYSRYIESPVLRLKFLNSALRSEPRVERFSKLPFIGLLQERAMLVVEVSKLLPLDQPAPLALRLSTLLYRMRYAVYACFIALALSAAAGVVYTAIKIINSFSVSTQAKNASLGGNESQAATGSAGGVEALRTGAALPLEKIWLAENGEGYEFYSNGARVLTEFQTGGAERRFYSFNLDSISSSSDEAELMTRPVGIVYHISESDMLPFDDSHNSKLQNYSRALLEYAKEKRLYNYVIDRFGRTYRIVEDDEMANHAGNSVWSDGKSVYVNLSPSFIGVCFEGKYGAGETVGPERINEAQIYAARVLTAVLRSKYQIDDANCVTHGLVSVNPSNRLMGYHTDWVSDFPFEAIGLTNKYQTELVAISHFGFGYDQAYVNAAGGVRWAGLEQADAALSESAKKKGLSIEELRRALSKAYQRAFAKQRAAEKGVMSNE